MTTTIITNSFRGGTGKSTVISNVGSYLASIGMKVIIVDADIVSPGVHAIFGLDASSFDKTLTDYLTGGANVSDIVYDISDNLELPEDALSIVPSSMAKGEIAEFLNTDGRSNKLTQVIKELSEQFQPDFILLDTHPGINEELLIAAGVTDVLFNIVRPDNQDYQGLTVSSEIAKKLKLKLYVILNKVHPKLNKKDLIENIKKKFKLPVAGALPLSEELILSQSQFVFSDKYPEHEFSKEIQSIVTDVFGIKPKTHLEIMYEFLTQIKDKVDEINVKIPTAKYNRYIEDLTDREFIREAKKGSYLITDKGSKFLKKYKSIRKFIRNFRL